jgi:hypothetical protein
VGRVLRPLRRAHLRSRSGGIWPSCLCSSRSAFRWMGKSRWREGGRFKRSELRLGDGVLEGARRPFMLSAAWVLGLPEARNGADGGSGRKSVGQSSRRSVSSAESVSAIATESASVNHASSCTKGLVWPRSRLPLEARQTPLGAVPHSRRIVPKLAAGLAKPEVKAVVDIIERRVERSADPMVVPLHGVCAVRSARKVDVANAAPALVLFCWRRRAQAQTGAEPRTEQKKRIRRRNVSLLNEDNEDTRGTAGCVTAVSNASCGVTSAQH